MTGLISKAALAANTPQKPAPFAAVLEPFVGLYCVKKGWGYGELWLVDPEAGSVLASCVFNTDDDGALRRFDSFATLSRARYAALREPRVGVISRVIATGRPEWLNDLSSDAVAFERAGLAAEHGMSVGTAVPVMLDANRCAAVLFFAGEEPRSFSIEDFSTLLEYTATLGSLYEQYLAGFQTAGHRPIASREVVESAAGEVNDAGLLAAEIGFFGKAEFLGAS